MIFRVMFISEGALIRAPTPLSLGCHCNPWCWRLSTHSGMLIPSEPQAGPLNPLSLGCHCNQWCWRFSTHSGMSIVIRELRRRLIDRPPGETTKWKYSTLKLAQWKLEGLCNPVTVEWSCSVTISVQCAWIPPSTEHCSVDSLNETEMCNSRDVTWRHTPSSAFPKLP
jgi:hypothetical protein